MSYCGSSSNNEQHSQQQQQEQQQQQQQAVIVGQLETTNAKGDLVLADLDLNSQPLSYQVSFFGLSNLKSINYRSFTTKFRHGRFYHIFLHIFTSIFLLI